MVIHTDRAEAGGLLASPTCPPNGPSNTKFSAFPSNSAPHSNQTHLALEVVVPCRTIGLQYRLLAFRRTKYFWPQQGNRKWLAPLEMTPITHLESGMRIVAVEKFA